MKRALAIPILLFAIVAATAPGCAEVDRQEVAEAIALLETEAAKLPEGDPARREIEKAVAKAKQHLAALDAVASGDFSALAQYGPFGAYIGLALALAWKIKQSAERRAALKKVVESVEVAIPDKTDAQKELLAKVQGPAVSAVVEKIKSAGV